MSSTPSTPTPSWLSRRYAAPLLVLFAFVAGWLLRTATRPAATPASAEAGGAASEAQTTTWTCAMHPQIQLPRPGPCPICGMDLIPLEGSSTSEAPTVVVTEADRARMRLRTTRVERRAVEAEIRMTGKLDYDEKRVTTITSRVDGRIDRLFVDYTGVEVQAGDHLVELFSPKLYSAQAELLQTLGAARAEGQTLDAARERLRQLGLTEAQVAAVEERGTPTDVMTIYAPQGGIVLDKAVKQGEYVSEGTRIYTIADLEHLWVMLDAYEVDLEWLRYGQTVEFTTEAYADEVFTGTIAFIDPVLDDRTRTVKVRVNVENPRRRLKPNMFAKAIVRPRIAAGGRVMDPNLSGRWICPMHPEIVRAEAHACDLCGMDLVTTESLGYVSVEEEPGELPLVVPKSAVLRTGKRAVVYVEVPGAEQPTYAGREILLGARAGDWFLVESGLEAGELVVTQGNFKLDSALQIRAKPSMMSLPDRGAEEPHVRHPATPELRAALEMLWVAYRTLRAELAADSAAGLEEVVEALDALVAVPAPSAAEAQLALQLLAREAAARLDDVLASGAELEALRTAFAPLSEAVALAAHSFGLGQGDVYLMECPMALDDGARWLQDTRELENPYFGESMLGCGSVVETLRGNER